MIVLLLGACVVRGEDTPAQARLKKVAAEMAKFGMPVDVTRVRLTVRRLVGDEMIAESPLARGSATAADGILDQGWGRPSEPSRLDAAAYYLPSQRRLTFFAAGSAAWIDGDSLAAHELAHALQHQRDPMSLGHWWSTTERNMIQTCMVEGEAQLAGLMLRIARRGGKLEEVDFSAADYASRVGIGDYGVFAPYTVGLRFMGEHAQRIGVRRLPEVYAKRPESTEQILHPSKFGRDRPTRIRFPELPAADLMKADTLGELALWEQFAAQGDLVTGLRASVGWDGDRLRVCETADREWYVVWVSVWDREVDAIQAERVLRQVWNRGTTMREGRTVSWAYSAVPKLRDRVTKALRGWDCSGEIDPEAAASTARVESEFLRRTARSHRAHKGRWHLPDVGVSIPVPEGWSVEVESTDAIMRRSANQYDRVTVDAWPMAAFGDYEGLSDFVGRLSHPLHWMRVTQVSRISRDGVKALIARRRPMEGRRKMPLEIMELYVPVGGTVIRYMTALDVDAGAETGRVRRAVLRAFRDFRVER